MPEKNPIPVGSRFTRLIVLGPGEPKTSPGDPYPRPTSKCLCDCGKIIYPMNKSLKAGNTKSCGCFHRFQASAANRTHGQSKTAAYDLWCGIIKRCYNPNCINYRDYGGRGITMCDRWRNSFEAFLEDMGEPPEGHWLERKNNSLGYSQENCKWATPTEQNRNKRSNHLLTVGDETHCISYWAEKFNLQQGTIFERIRKGWPVDKLFIPPMRTRRKMEF